MVWNPVRLVGHRPVLLRWLAPCAALVLALGPAGLGLMFGQWLRLRTHPTMFLRVFAAGLLLIGLYLALRTLI